MLYKQQNAVLFCISTKNAYKKFNVRERLLFANACLPGLL